MVGDRSFGGWLRQRRRALDLTQAQLAGRVGCSTVTLRKLEAETRKPSRQIAERLAEILQVAPDERLAFLRFARGDAFAGLPDSGTPAASESALPPRNNLPLQLTPFIGREPEVAAIQQLGLARTNPPKRNGHSGAAPAPQHGTEDGARLVTLTGAGGSGKTRLALRAAGDWLEAAVFADGVWLVELAPLLDAALVPQAVANVLGLKEAPSRPLIDILVHHLRPRQLLLLLDNCEHLIQASAELTERLLAACPRLSVLATSREALNIAGERVFLVPTLATPQASESKSPEWLARYDAVRLFVERAQAARPGFKLTQGNAAAVAQVCRQLDGIPLAIELAAARVKVLRVAEIAAGLNDRFQLLRGGSRTALPRHQTLQALVDWSYDLLTEPERALLRRLAVFAGGWTLDAAKAVCAGDGVDADAVLDLLSQLVSKSLVSAERTAEGGTRYAVLETIRQYALAKLEASGEGETTRQKHALYYTELAATWKLLLETKHHRAGLDRFETEIDNFRAAMPWVLAQTDVELEPRFAGVLWRFLWDRGSWREARLLLENALAVTGGSDMARTEARALALGRLGAMTQYQSNYTDGERLLSQSLRLAEEIGLQRWTAWTLYHLGLGRRERGDADTASGQLKESVARFRQLEAMPWSITALNCLAGVAILQEDAALATAIIEEALPLNQVAGVGDWLGWSLNVLAHVAQLEGDFRRAAERHAESLHEFHELDLHLGLAWANLGLGEAALGQNDAAAAQTYLNESLKLFHDLGDRTGVSWCLAGLAGAALLDEEPILAGRLWGAAEALRQAIGCRPAPASRVTRERLIDAAREQLGDAAFDAAWAEGQTLTLEQAVALTLDTAA